MSNLPDVIEIITPGGVDTIVITDSHSVIDVILPAPIVTVVDVNAVGIQGPQGPPGPLSDEIIIQNSTPSTSGSYEFWIDTRTAALDQYAKVNGNWTLTGGSNEVIIQASDPGTAYDLWYDTDDTLVVDAYTWTPTGTIRSTIVQANEPGWLTMDGTSYPNADTQYSSLWALLPATMKSGTTMILPDTRNRFPMGAGNLALGAVGGSNSLTLVTGNLPTHNHTMNHNHTGTVAIDNANVNHQHLNNFMSQAMDRTSVHSHSQTIVATNGGTPGLRADYDTDTNTGNPLPQNVNSGGADINHLHHVYGNTDAANPVHNHTGSVSINTLTANTGNVGSGAAIDSTPACFIVVWKIKT